jgi:small subunit ribosomal protein S18
MSVEYGDRNRDSGGPGGGGPGGDRSEDKGPRKRFTRRFHRRKVCRFCVAKDEYIDYKDARRLGRYVSDRGKMLPRRVTGCCARHQRMLTTAIKRARNIALLPFKAA